jgi:hypothetical protein
MATLYITELSNSGNSNTAPYLQMAAQPPIAEQTVAIGASSAQSSALNAATKFVRLFTDTVCGISFGTNPTAGATSARMAANTTEYFGVPQGQSFKVAVITP